LSVHATLALRQNERAEVGIGLTLMMPDVASSHPLAGTQKSDGDLYAMPTISRTKNTGP
jgi:hypothetical protein